MIGRESLTALSRPEFLVQIAGANLSRMTPAQRRRLMDQLEAFCRDPRERLRGEMRPRPTWDDITRIQRSVQVFLEGTVLPGGPRAGAREDEPAITVQDLRVTASSSSSAVGKAVQAALRDFRPVQAALDVYSITASSAPLDIVMLLTVATLAQGPFPPITRCGDPHCPRKWFVSRGKKRFCNDTCRVRAFVRVQRAAMRQAEKRELEERHRRPGERPSDSASASASAERKKRVKRERLREEVRLPGRRRRRTKGRARPTTGERGKR